MSGSKRRQKSFSNTKLGDFINGSSLEENVKNNPKLGDILANSKLWNVIRNDNVYFRLKLKDIKKEYGKIFNKYQDLAIGNYELRIELEREKQKIKYYKSMTNNHKIITDNYKLINNTFERILKIEEETIVKKDLKIQLLEEYLKDGCNGKGRGRK